jgi:hypothetical protein
MFWPAAFVEELLGFCVVMWTCVANWIVIQKMKHAWVYWSCSWYCCSTAMNSMKCTQCLCVWDVFMCVRHVYVCETCLPTQAVGVVLHILFCRCLHMNVPVVLPNVMDWNRLDRPFVNGLSTIRQTDQREGKREMYTEEFYVTDFVPGLIIVNTYFFPKVFRCDFLYLWIEFDSSVDQWSLHFVKH